MAIKHNHYLAADVRTLDHLAIEEKGIPGFTLMQRAGEATFDALVSSWPDCKNLLCFCGNGNNGGDGYVIAAVARKRGLDATVIAIGNPENLRGDARMAFNLAIESKVTVIPFQNLSLENIPANTVIVDAMLGTGLTGSVRGNYLEAIESVNSLDKPVVAVDIPSGLCSDTGNILGAAVKAELTVTFIGRKVGQVLNSGPMMCGRLIFDDLGVPPDIYEKVPPQ